MAAAELFEQDVPQAEITRRLGVTPQAMFKWRKRWLAEGAEGLRSTGSPGYPPLLNDQQRADLAEVVKAGPEASGFDSGWTLARVATVIGRRFGVVYRYPSAVWNLLHQLGFTVQHPARHVVERDEWAIAEWREHTCAQLVEQPAPAERGSAAPTSPASA